ncbi:PucR family transcriptional regulator [Amycolatopsis sp. H20-H5]|uniref:PucR family transcriptional regulator n=1 Tax=Amycolatopsis sp. H20-H5 TaxID=3046309 RepID=UPI002DB9A123|nr:PucR family transcriptional regulator ligand-binding domain-containing protein [Amycolatopsis sp. H20-H5]MEC3976342.1 PucR family transcriptional regulator ligand-binding domain-containing protein [Amycolatopsis sp. H20-H5]
MTTVKTLLALPGLRLRPRTGTARLDRPVTRIYVTELPDPGRYLSAGELVLSGLLWWHQPGDADSFVAQLASAGASALAASGADSGGIPQDLIDACVRHDIPLLEVPTDLSFAVVIERVVLALASSSGTARKRLLSAAADDESPESLLDRATTELRVPGWVLSTTGRVVAGPDPLPERADELARRFVAARGRPTEVAGLSLSPVGGRPAVPWFVAVATRLTTAQGEVVDELAGLIGVARARAEQVRRVTDRAVEPLLAVLEEGGDPRDTFAATGLSGSVRFLLARTEGTRESGDVLAELLANHPSRVLLGEPGEDTYAVVEDNGDWPDDWARRAAAALSTVEPMLSAPRVLLSFSDPTTVTGLRGAKEIARHALAVAAARPGPVAVVPAGEIGVHRLLLAGASDEFRAALRERVLGPLLAYDAEQNTELVHTLRTFLGCSGSPTRAARALHVHVNTLRYRIGRASELLGADLTEFTEQLDVYLALLAESD